MRTIALTKGYVATVDDEDYPLLARYSWQAAVRQYTVYACRHEKRAGEKRCILMHRQIIAAPRHMQVDHRDRNGLNNVRSNLRLATNLQNVRNRVSNRGTSRFKGVFWDKQRGKWKSTIKVDRRAKHLGFFADEARAAEAYDRAARQYFGEFALTNQEAS